MRNRAWNEKKIKKEKERNKRDKKRSSTSENCNCEMKKEKKKRLGDKTERMRNKGGKNGNNEDGN